MADFVSYKNRIHDFGFKSGSFKNESGETVDYKQTVLVVDFEGEKEEIVLSGGTAPKPKVLQVMLRGASKTTVSGNMLEDDN